MFRFSAISACAFLLVGELAIQFDQTASVFAADTPTARYRLTFDGVWSAETHPIDFPTAGGTHFSGLIGGTHNGQVIFWELGGLATPGMQEMAERGLQDPLAAEVEFAMAQGRAGEVIMGPILIPAASSLSITFTVTQDFPLVTLGSMFGPSPDWFVGVDRLQLFQNDQWVPELVVSLQPYDAGTEDGTTYDLVNPESVPHVPIFQITGLPFSDDGPIVPVGTFTFTRIDVVPAVSEWGYAVMMLLVLTVGSVTLRQRAIRFRTGRTSASS